MAAEKIDIAQIIDSSAYLVFNAQRKATFNNGKWVYDKEEGAACTGVKLADAGFCNTSTRSDPSAATCVFCLKEMIFDSTDDPWQEHVDHCPDCLFVRFNQQEDNLLTIEQFINLIAFRKTKTMSAWLETQMKQVSSAVEYVQKMKPK